MSQDITADGLNQLMNAKRAGKTEITLKKFSKVLLGVLAIAKLRGHVESYEQDGTDLKVTISKLNGAQAIKPRLRCSVQDIDRYTQRYLPAKDIGTLILSTSQGLMTHQTAQEKNVGGFLIAYLY
ncbi:30S ribosomal protein S8 [Candidatus Pacearchaeota archaeon]|jgi:small subunit ribosomal protein S8|nr:30S ribosomal protein S8 [Candidatus Pacearchaeota archaeon]